MRGLAFAFGITGVRWRDCRVEHVLVMRIILIIIIIYTRALMPAGKSLFSLLDLSKDCSRGHHAAAVHARVSGC
jgi:hypothetical protein